MALGVGRFQLHAVNDGTIALDGGGMFGAVPRVLWERHFRPDERNRITLALRCLLIIDGPRLILVDDGAGPRWDGRHRDMFGLTGSHLDVELANLGLTRVEVTDVVLTHLHFDHAGGTTREDHGELTLAFPRATFHLQRRHWKWAHQPAERDAASFRRADFAPLERSGRLHLLEGNTELYPGVHVIVSEGHTVAMQLVRLEDGDASLMFCADLIPTTAHLRSAWVSAHDLYPLTTIEEKKQLLAQAVEERTVIFFEHDPLTPACTVTENSRGDVVVDTVLSL